jgi:hypothetical protein
VLSPYSHVKALRDQVGLLQERHGTRESVAAGAAGVLRVLREYTIE